MTRPMLTYSRSPYSRTKLKMNPRHLSSHNRRSSRVVGLFGQIENRIENQFALLDPSARQPLDLHEELGAEPEQRLLGDRPFRPRRSAPRTSRFRHSRLVDVVLAELGRRPPRRTSAAAFRRRPSGSRRRARRNRKAAKSAFEKPPPAMKNATSGLSVAVDAGGKLADLRQVPPQRRFAQAAELRERLDRSETACPSPCCNSTTRCRGWRSARRRSSASFRRASSAGG